MIWLSKESTVQSKKLLSFQEMTDKEYIIFIICFLLGFFYNFDIKKNKNIKDIVSLNSFIICFITLILFSLYNFNSQKINKFDLKNILYTYIKFDFQKTLYTISLLFIILLISTQKIKEQFLKTIQRHLVPLLVIFLIICVFLNININLPYIYIFLGLLFGFALNTYKIQANYANYKEYFTQNHPIFNLFILFLNLYFFKDSGDLKFFTLFFILYFLFF